MYSDKFHKDTFQPNSNRKMPKIILTSKNGYVFFTRPQELFHKNQPLSNTLKTNIALMGSPYLPEGITLIKV